MRQLANSRALEPKLSCLHEMRNIGGSAMTRGIRDEVIRDFLETHADLGVAIDRAYERFVELKESRAEFLALDESEQVRSAHSGLTNFYAKDAVNPYVALAGSGPWIITLKGAVVYDCGGYGMLGLGHAPDAVLDAMNKPHVMANIMTASVNQVDLVAAVEREVGHTRPGGMPYASLLCMNSGSEAMTVAARIADIHSKNLTDPGARYEGREVRGLTLKGSFHGRTDRPARVSDSTRKAYTNHLASYRDDNYVFTVEPNNIDALEAVFAKAEEDNLFIEAFFMEPVMGEGNPGLPIEPEFYRRARELTREHDTMLIVDSIQAGFRAHGVLSIVDYPGFREFDEPDMESYSKSLNAGQFPLSVLVLSEKAADTYQRGLYGNTMTTNPRCLDVAVAVLESITPELRENICTRGRELLAGFEKLADETDNAVTGVQGTGLLLSCELNERYKVFGADSTEDHLRKIGLAVIHGGARSLRYTPVFNIGPKEVDLIVSLTKEALLEGPQG